ncbi:unnamed protein product [Owenia fusiformis]|uniref:YqaJ viral recombinase domain-containing protein n=1 Tax=Owenia fusiformis TaxID=6347 RepID=A0A8S4NMD1_OWEFU|nr:unnamed protein product [Owenia fusiformis]
MGQCEIYGDPLVFRSSGIVRHPTIGYIRGSPDGFVSCKCKTYPMEIKCPYHARDMSINEVVECGKLKFINKEHNLLICEHDYFAHVQGIMGLTNANNLHFIVWTTNFGIIYC